jgi:hypothetical protein
MIEDIDRVEYVRPAGCAKRAFSPESDVAMASGMDQPGGSELRAEDLRVVGAVWED